MSPLRMLIKNLGLQTEVNEISKKEKFLRKKIHRGLQVGIQQGKDDDSEISSNTQYVCE